MTSGEAPVADRYRTRLAVFGVALALITAGLLLVLGLSAPPTPIAGSVFNLDPNFASSSNDPVWDPNFLPGFNSSLPLHLNWTDPAGGPGKLDYLVGPLSAPPGPGLYPHFAVGPQVFSFIEIPRTQIYRSPAWGDYSHVQSGFQLCALNVADPTVNASVLVSPRYMGMNESGVDWHVMLNLSWLAPERLSGLGPSGSAALVVTSVLPPLPGTQGARLVYTQLVLWNASIAYPAAALVTPQAPATPADQYVVGVVSFPVDQLPASSADRSYSWNLGGYLAQTFIALNLPEDQALLSYVYLYVGGYNVRLQLGISSMYLVAPSSICHGALPPAVGGVGPEGWAVLPVVTTLVRAEFRSAGTTPRPLLR